MKFMKKLITVVLLCGLLMTLCGAASKKDTKSTDSTEETTMAQASGIILGYSEITGEADAEYRYNPQGQLLQKIQPDWDRVTEYEYYPDGILSQETILSKDKISAVLKYDRKGNLISHSNADEKGKLEPYIQRTNYYDDQGRLLEQRELNHGSNRSYTAVYTYPEDGTCMIDLSVYGVTDKEQIPFSHRTGIFLENGMQISGSYDLDELSPVCADLKRTVDDKGNLTGSMRTSDLDGLYERSTIKYENTYDAKGQLKQVKEYHSEFRKKGDKVEEDMPMTLWGTTDYTYDTDGRLVRKVYTSNITDGEYKEESIWEYDSAGRLFHFAGWKPLPDLEYFFQGKGEASYEMEETYHYRLLDDMQVLD